LAEAICNFGKKGTEIVIYRLAHWNRLLRCYLLLRDMLLRRLPLWRMLLCCHSRLRHLLHRGILLGRLLLRLLRLLGRMLLSHCRMTSQIRSARCCHFKHIMPIDCPHADADCISERTQIQNQICVYEFLVILTCYIGKKGTEIVINRLTHWNRSQVGTCDPIGSILASNTRSGVAT
jgi:hypothetical protein